MIQNVDPIEAHHWDGQSLTSQRWGECSLDQNRHREAVRKFLGDKEIVWIGGTTCTPGFHLNYIEQIFECRYNYFTSNWSASPVIDLCGLFIIILISVDGFPSVSDSIPTFTFHHFCSRLVVWWCLCLSTDGSYLWKRATSSVIGTASGSTRGTKSGLQWLARKAWSFC